MKNMNEKKIINYAIAIFALTIFALAVIPKLFAEGTNNTTTYKLDIPCAIDRTQIVIPNRFDKNYTGHYKAKCNSNAYLNSETGEYHLKKNEGYYLNIELTNDSLNKIDLSEIDSVVLDFYKEDNDQSCFTRKMTPVYNDNTRFAAKIGYVKDNDSREFGQENMTGFIDSCEVEKPITFNLKITLKTGEQMSTSNVGLIKTIVLDSDNSNIVAENARSKAQVRNQISEKSLAEKPLAEKPKEQLTTRLEIKIKDSELFLTTENTTQKMIQINEIFKENKINSEKVVGDIILDTEFGKVEYVFEVKEKRKLFGFIPIGEKIVERRISAIREIKE
jgi:hypothetical protein